METRLCSVCRLHLPATIEYFYRHTTRGGCVGFYSQCKKCKKERTKLYPIEGGYSKRVYLNRPKMSDLERKKKFAKYANYYYHKHKERIRAGRKKYKLLHPSLPKKRTPEQLSRRRIRESLRIKNDPSFRISRNMGTTIYLTIKGEKGGRKWQDLVGYTLNDLKSHLESKFLVGMSWNNYGRNGWHIDHIKPRSLFEIKSKNDVQFRECWSLNNLQPLWERDNIRKGNRYTETAQ